MRISKRDCLATLVIFVIVVLTTEIIDHLPETWFMSRQESMRHAIQGSLLKDLANRDEDLARSLGLIRGRYDSLPIGKEAGLEAGRQRLRRLQDLFPTREALFPIVAKNYLVQFFIDKSLEVTITERSSSYSSPQLNTPSPFEEIGDRQPEQRLTLGDAHQYVTRLYMVEYLPVAGGFKANVAFRRLSADPDYVLTGSENLRFEPWDADERCECSGCTSQGENGVADKIAWGNPQKVEEVGTFAYRAFVFPDRRMQKTVRGMYLASPPVVVRVSPASGEEHLGKESKGER